MFSDLFICDTTIDNGIIADRSIGDDDSSKFIILDHSMTHGDLFYDATISIANRDIITDAKRLKGQDEYAANNIGKCFLRGETNDSRQDSCTGKESRSEVFEVGDFREDPKYRNAVTDEPNRVFDKNEIRWIDFHFTTILQYKKVECFPKGRGYDPCNQKR